MPNKQLNEKKFLSDGFQILRGLFSPEEFKRMRESVYNSLKKNKAAGVQMVDALGDEFMAPYVYDSRVLDVARELLKSDNICYFGDASYAVIGHNYDVKTATGWHRDNTDRTPNKSSPDWQTPYTLIRFGFYLQDHKNKSGGLMIRQKSHNGIKSKYKIVTLLRERYINTNIGDVAVWNMRASHSGVGKCLKWFSQIAISPYLENKIPSFLIAPNTTEERAAFWVSYGINDAHLKRHCDYLMHRSERKKMWENSYYSPETLKACKEAGLQVIDMPSRMRQAIDNGEEVGGHDHHYQFNV